MAEIAYLDFDLLIEPAPGGYRARVLSSPAGRATARFSKPFSDLEVENFLLRIGRPRANVRRLESPEMQAARTFGGRLFEAVFDDEIRGRLRSSLNEASRQGAGLRIRLRLAETPELADLPWEYLYDPVLERFLVLSVETPLVRYIDLPQLVRPLAVQPPLRVLAMIASPADCHPLLNVDQEWARIKEALIRLEQRKLVALERLEEATLAALQRRLRRGEYHIFHFVGHGGFYEHVQDGVLMVEDERGRGRPVSGRYLGTMLHDHRSLRLAILNSCEGARASRTDPFAGIAQSLVQQGIPAVIAMQFPITDQAAITLAHEFYAALADGYSVDAALAEARKAIFASSKDVEWGTPVLHLRAPDGRIFDIAQAQTPGTSISDILPRIDAQDLEERLAQLYTDGLGAFYLERWEEACRCFQSIIDVRPDYRQAADRLAEAQRQQKLSELHARAQAAAESEAWPEAIAALEELVAIAPEFKDATSLLERAQKQKRLSELYAEAKQLYQAERWRAVVNAFAQIQAIEPAYADAEGLLPAAEQGVAELERQAELDALYGRAVREMDAGRWQDAAQLLARVQEMEPGFHEVEHLLERAETEIERAQAERSRQAQVQTLYEQAQELARLQQWQQALAKMGEIQALDADFIDTEQVAARAQGELERQRRRTALYERAQAAREAGDWQEALSALQELTSEAPDDREAAATLQAVSVRAHLADLYAEAQRAHQAAQWQAVVDAFSRMRAIEPNYPDPDGLLSAAKREIAEETRRAELSDLYGRAVHEMEAGHWPEAQQVLARIQATEPGFREVDRLLVRAEAEIEREKNERQRREQVAVLYEQAQSLVHHRQWQQALAKMREIQALDPQFDDPQGVAARAQEAATREEREAQRQRELAVLYAEAVRLLQARQYQEALEKWSQVQRLDPRYPDRKKVQSTAQKTLAALARGARPRPRLPRWAALAIGGLALVIVVASAVLLRGALGGRRQQLAEARATPTAQPPSATQVPDAAPNATVKATQTAQTRATTDAKVWAARTRSRATVDAALTRMAQTRTPTSTSAFKLPAPVSDVLADAVVVDHDDFGSLSSSKWTYDRTQVKISGGLAEIVGLPPGPGSRLERTQSLSEGEGVLVLFRYDSFTNFTFNLGSGEWGTSSWREWDIGGDTFDTWFTPGTSSDVHEGPLAGDIKSSPRTWYYLLLAVGNDGEIVASVWEHDEPSHKAEYRRTFGEDWAGRDWQFWIDASFHRVYLDAFTAISFSETKSPAGLPSPVSEVLVDAAVVEHDDLDTLRSSRWTHDGRVSTSEGMVEMIGIGNWDTRIDGTRDIQTGQGVLLLFKYSSGADFVADLHSGEWGTSWKRVDFENVWWDSHVWRKNSVIHESVLATRNLTPDPDQWYYLLLAVAKEGKFLIRTWERDDPSRTAEHRWHLGPDWDGLSWKLRIMIDKNTVYLDSFTEISFSELNEARF